MVGRLLATAAALIAAAALAIWLLGTLPYLRGWRDGLGFVGTLLLLIPATMTEVIKHQISRLEARIVEIRDPATQRTLGHELTLLERHLQRFHRWHAWLYTVGILMLALAFRLGL